MFKKIYTQIYVEYERALIWKNELVVSQFME